MSAEPMIEVRGLKKSFGEIEVLRNISLTVERGQVVGLIGPSGSGKSTLLRSLNLLSLPDAGYIAIGDQKIDFSSGNVSLKDKYLAAFRANTGMVFQNFNLFPHMTVLENIIEAPIQVRGLARDAAVRLALDLLARVGLSDKVEAYPRQLSGGQQQRVAIARALALRPKVILFDEPTSALDPELVGEVLDVIKELARTGTTLVIVTHETGFAREVADTVVFMEAGQIVEAGPPSRIFNDAQHPRTREFLAKVL
nr:amino acid ABC transporter ATP-binding protein [Brucella anthropi]